MGVHTAFDPWSAAFDRLGSLDSGENIYISNVVHKTFINVDEYGTEAAAVTAASTTGSAAPSKEEPKHITLDRPFVYMILDLDTNTPLFIGTYMGD